MYEHNDYTSANQWKTYCPSIKAGRLCYYLCTTQSCLPVRDAKHKCCDVEHKCTEPNYETETYNLFCSCNQRNVHSDVEKNRASHILFHTKYHGTKKSYKNRIFIVGYYEIGWSRWVCNKRTAIRAKNLHFVSVEHAYEMTCKRWKRIKPDGAEKLTNLRWLTQRITGDVLDEILQHLSDKPNRVDDYVKEVQRLQGH